MNRRERHVDSVTLLELLDRALDKGVVLSGDLYVSVAGVELLYVGIRAVVASVARLHQLPARLAVRPGGEAASDEQ